jgi:glycosyltransferase involved in cell wall biosynthesis
LRLAEGFVVPLVSVIVPTHNRPVWLAEALASIRAQTFTDYEIVVVSNGEGPEMRRLSQAAAISSNARWFALDDGNASAARNFGVEQATTEWIAFLDDDDVWLPEKLERQMAEARRTGADMVACDCTRFFPDGEEIPVRFRVPDGWSYVKAINHLRWGASPSVILMRRAVFTGLGGFDPAICIGEDADLWRRVSWRHRIYEIHDPLMRYRGGHPSLSQGPARWDDIYRFLKMYRDTPSDLRGTLPPMAPFMRRWLVRAVMPAWLRQPRKYWLELRPRIQAAIATIAGLV